MEKVRLGDIATLINGDRGKNYPSQADISDEGDIPFVNAGHLNGRNIDFEEMNYISQDKYKRLSSGKFVKGDVLYCLRGSLGKKAIVNDDVEGAIASSLVIIRPNYDRIDGEYLMFSLDSPSIKEQLNKANNGSSQPNLSAASVREYQIELPDLKKQKDIVKKLVKTRSIIDSRQHEIDLLDELIKARFVELFGDLMENPLGWTVMTIADVSTFLKSGLSRKLSDDDIGLPVIRSGNIQDGQFIFDDVKYWYIDDPQGANTKDYILNDGDILVNFINSSSQIGKTAIYRDTGRDCIYTTNIFRMKLADNCNEYYYNWFAMSDYYYRHLQNIIQPAVNQASFTTVNFLKLPIPLPPKEKQGKFADFVKQVDKSKFVVQKSLDEAKLVFDSLMQEFFG